MEPMATPPESTKASLSGRLHAHAATRWPQLTDLHIRHRGPFAYIAGQLADGEKIPLMRLRYLGSAAAWGFGLYLASKDGYEDTILPTGTVTGTPEQALDCACDLYLSIPDI